MKIPTGRRWLWGAAAIAAVLVLFAVNAGKMLVVDDPQPSDVIVALAGETDHRPAAAIQLLDRGFAKRVLIDVPREATVFESSELQLAKKYVQDLPEHSSVEICPIAGLSTRDESHDVEQCLAHVPGSRVLLVTSDFHTRRALSTFRHEIREKSFAVAAARDDAQFGTHWWMHRQWAKTCLDEWLRLVWWNAIERWK